MEYFRHYAPRLLAQGYRPIPTDGKDARLIPWKPYQTTPPTLAEVNGWASEFGDADVAVVCTDVVAIDIDVDLDAADATDIAERIEGIAFDIFGPTPAVRIGRFPRRVLVYRCDQPIEYAERNLVQILGFGRVFTAYGIHPDIQKPYTWPSTPLHEIPRDHLPTIDKAKVDRFLAALEAEGLVLPKEEKKHERTSAPKALPDDPEAYAAAAYRHEIVTLAQVQTGNRNKLLNDAALKLGSFVGSGLLDERMVREGLRVASELVVSHEVV